MIRLFNIFCKLNLIITKTAKVLFDEAVASFNIADFPCPSCGSRHPGWSLFDDYERNLISYADGKHINEIVTVLRYLCSSCGHTHAIIPEIAIPYSVYSIFFVLAVLRDRFINKMTIDSICQKYIISARTFYRWKKLYEQNKQLWLGVLDDISTDSDNFFEKHPSPKTSNFLYEFWLRHGLSFLQHSHHGEKVHFDIRLHPPPAFSPGFYIT